VISLALPVSASRPSGGEGRGLHRLGVSYLDLRTNTAIVLCRKIGEEAQEHCGDESSAHPNHAFVVHGIFQL
jgi:hypothetical protein